MAYLDEGKGKFREAQLIGEIELLDQTISEPPTQAQVQELSDKVDELLEALRNSGMKAEPAEE